MIIKKRNRNLELKFENVSHKQKVLKSRHYQLAYKSTNLMLFYLVVDLRVLQRENKKINAIVPMIQTRFSLVMIHTVFFFFKFIRKSRQNA